MVVQRFNKRISAIFHNVRPIPSHPMDNHVTILTVRRKTHARIMRNEAAPSIHRNEQITCHNHVVVPTEHAGGEIPLVDDFAMSTCFPARPVHRRRRQCISGVVVFVHDIQGTPLTNVSHRSAVDVLSNTSRHTTGHPFATETRQCGRCRLRCRLGTAFVGISSETSNNSDHGNVFWVDDEPDARCTFGSKSDATNTTIPLVDVAARSA